MLSTSAALPEAGLSIAADFTQAPIRELMQAGAEGVSLACCPLRDFSALSGCVPSLLALFCTACQRCLCCSCLLQPDPESGTEAHHGQQAVPSSTICARVGCSERRACPKPCQEHGVICPTQSAQTSLKSSSVVLQSLEQQQRAPSAILNPNSAAASAGLVSPL